MVLRSSMKKSGLRFLCVSDVERFLFKARGFLLEADKKEAAGDVFKAPSQLASESYQSLFDQVLV